MTKLPGRHPRLAGEGERVHTMRFAEMMALDAGRGDIAAAVRAWWAWKDGG